eukprot:353609-Chlamydomonas_euryale.AAC.1
MTRSSASASRADQMRGGGRERKAKDRATRTGKGHKGRWGNKETARARANKLGHAKTHTIYKETAALELQPLLQLWTAQPPLAVWIRRGQPAHIFCMYIPHLNDRQVQKGKEGTKAGKGQDIVFELLLDRQHLAKHDTMPVPFS